MRPPGFGLPLRRLSRKRGLTLSDGGLAGASVAWGFLVGGTSGAGIILLSLLMAVGLPCVIGMTVLAPGISHLFLGKSFRAAATQIIQALTGRLRFTPTAATHTYGISAFCSNTGGTPAVGAGAGGINTLVPAFLRITKA